MAMVVFYLTQAFRFNGMDVEEMMLMEAMRRSMQDSVPVSPVQDSEEDERRAIEESINGVASIALDSSAVAASPLTIPVRETIEEPICTEIVHTSVSEYIEVIAEPRKGINESPQTFPGSGDGGDESLTSTSSAAHEKKASFNQPGPSTSLHNDD